MEEKANEGQQPSTTDGDQTSVGSEQPSQQTSTSVQQDTYSSTGTAVSNELYMQQSLIMDQWILGALMFIGGILAVIAFFVARGESHG